MNNVTHTTCKLISLCCLLSALLFQGCALSPKQPVYYPPPPPKAAKQPTIEVQPVKPPAPKEPNAIVASLSQQAAEQNLQGRTDLAVATLERGLRIAPKDAMLWSQLAEVKLQQKEYQQAQSFAAKSNSLAGTNSKIMQKNYWIIEESQRRAAGQ
jgi:cytochrome c-type biogenesis protein CcmH/NrfG